MNGQVRVLMLLVTLLVAGVVLWFVPMSVEHWFLDIVHASAIGVFPLMALAFFCCDIYPQWKAERKYYRKVYRMQQFVPEPA